MCSEIVKSFPSQQAAQDFVDGKVVTSTSKDAGDKFYGVAVGKKPGVYTDWEVARLQVQDVKGPKYKKFATRKEAEEFVKSGGKVPAASTTKKDKLMAEDAEEKGVKKQKVGETKKKTTVYTDGSSLGNGQKGSVAGVGVYFGDLDPR